MEHVSHRGKRNRRRALREALHGPERRIVSTACGAHLLECGHQVLVVSTELSHIKRRRCPRCLIPTALEMNRKFLHVPEKIRLEYCEGCGASNSMVNGECRECWHRNDRGK